MNEERRTKLKLSKDARLLWEATEAIYGSVESMRRGATFVRLRLSLTKVPANQQRYYRRLMRLNAERFRRASLLSLSEDEFRSMTSDATPAQLAFIASELRAAVGEYVGDAED
jgi:hypothetical protein